MKKTIINLPGKYKNKSGNPKWDKYLNWNQLSHSTHEAFKNPDYRGEWMAQKFVGLELPQPLFASMGSKIGEYLDLSNQKVDEYLSLSDKAVLDSIEHPEDSEYEREIVIDMEPFGLEKTVFIGFIDRWSESLGECVDFKSGDTKKKKAYYSGSGYQQLNLYSYALEQEGHEIKSNKVILIDRGGNSMLYGAKYPMRLRGGVEYIDRVYSKQEAEDTLKDVVHVAKEIDLYYKTFNKYFG